MTTPASSFFEQPILNSPYEEPTRYHPLDAEGQPLNETPARWAAKV
jgi:type III restriction enzyme